MASEVSTSVQRALDILIALGAAGSRGDSLKVGEVARAVGREKSQVSRSLKTLAEAGFVDRDPETLAYRLGWRLFTLAESAGNHRLVNIAAPILRQLVSRIGERAHLSVLQGDHVLTVLSEQGSSMIQVIGWVGRSSPVHSTSAGQALLTGHSDTAVRQLLRDARFEPGGPASPKNIDEMLARLARARRQGYAWSDEEFEAGLVAAAAPVVDSQGRVIAAVNVSAPKFRLGRRRDTVGREVRAAADTISQLLQEAGEGTVA
ncbi:IclR family transcriptional regulator [Rhodococcus xishaensis]|uniref:IclR family transcriptional regulator n=1 Tax=Rhodococcus xishaensis TaxID=2487364 RepID=A0A3S3BGQ0_9NOCA|nr:IclR family transcriptional regulator [Rhodococcus xishaensis]RVW00815.1 IclR family transcriptional regulator [Rhodococcus xishaensis]